MRPNCFGNLAITLVCLGAPTAASAQLGEYEVIHSLSGNDGFGPQSGLVRGADDRLYGTATYGGGPDGAGTIYRISSNGTLRVIHKFRTTAPGGGLNPVSLIRGRDNHLYGTTEFGGMIGGVAVDGDGNPIGDGVIYKLSWDATRKTYDGVTVLYSFDCSKGGSGDPWGALVEGPDGALYGVTAPTARPDLNCAEPTTVYRVEKDGTGFTALAKFEYLISGEYQFGPLVFGTDGSIFGTLIDSLNPAFKFGTIFKIAPDGAVSYPKIFAGTDGAYPYSGLVHGVDGAFYGTTSRGGANDVGTIFRIDESGSFRSLYSFDSASINTPYSSLVAGGDGKLYGAAHAGGGTACNCGGSYVFDPSPPIGSDTGFTLHAMFDHTTTGSNPWGILGVGADHHLYGTQSTGGAANQGTLFGLLDLTVASRPPVPMALASPSPAEAQTVDGATVTLSALGSWDADFDVLTYAWTLPASVTNVVEAPDHSTVAATFPVTAPAPPLNVTLSVSDGTHTRSVTIPITVVDSPPTFGPAPDVTALAIAPSGVIVNYTVPTATDIVDGDVPVTCAPSSGSTFAIGRTTVRCSASDSAGQDVETSFVVTVTLDTIKPILTLTDIVVEATGTLTLVNYGTAASATDNGEIESFSCTPATGTLFAVRSTVVTCTATDKAGNISDPASLTVHVVDTTGPAITVPANIVVVAQALSGVPVTYNVSADDLVDGRRDVICEPPSGVTFPATVTTTVNCTSSDTRGHTSSKSFTVTVVTKPPSLTVTLNPGVLRPPNRTMVTVNATINVTYEGGLPPVVTLVSITSNESDSGLGNGDIADDIQGAAFGTDDRVFELRAERGAEGSGRIYTVTYKAAHPLDPNLATLVTATVTVPRDRSNKSN